MALTQAMFSATPLYATPAASSMWLTVWLPQFRMEWEK